MKLYVFVVALLAGCGGPSRSDAGERPPLAYTVVIDARFTAAETDDIVRGIDLWCGAVPELTVRVRTGDRCPDGDHVLCVQTSSVPSPIVLGHTQRDEAHDRAMTTLFPVLQQFNRTELTTTAAHELGHALGLVHTGAGTLMAPSYDEQAHDVTSADVDQLWSIR